MWHKRVLLGVLCWIVSTAPFAYAERASQSRKDAAFILTGLVESVEESWDGLRTRFRITIRVQMVERGRNVKEGDLFPARCFRQLLLPWMKGAAGHRTVPEVGDRVRVYVHARDGEGIYPDWCDILERNPWGWAYNYLDIRRPRSWCLLVGVGVVVGGWAVWRWRRSRRVNKVTPNR